jgi:hypothetical protein
MVEIARPRSEWAVLDVAASEGHMALKDSPPIAAEWLQGEEFDTPGASFAKNHIIIAGRK